MSGRGYFTDSSPMNVQFLKFKDEPFRWHNSIEVVIILEAGHDEQNSTSPYLIKLSELVKGDSHAYLKKILQENNVSPNNIFRFEETLDTANRDDFQVLTWLLNQFRENDILPVFIVRTSSNAIPEQITTIQGLLQNYTLTYGAEYMKGWRIELQ